MSKKPSNPSPTPDVQENIIGTISQGRDLPRKPSFSDMKGQLDPRKVAEVYDIRYDGGEESAYAKKFDPTRQLPEGEWYFLKNAVEKSLNSFRERTEDFKKDIAEWGSNTASEKEAPKAPSYNFIIFDFGCGDGRDLEFYRWFAEQVPDVNIVVKAYDISPVGIESYKEKLQKLQFVDLGAGDTPVDENIMTNHGILKEGNLLIGLLSPVNRDIDPSELAQAIGTVDITSSLYGPTSHIFPSELRDQFLKALVEMTRGDVVLTVPGKAMFLKEQETYRDQGLRRKLGLKKGEVFYSPSDLATADEDAEIPMLPYAVYSPEFLSDWLKRAGVEESDAQISVCSYKTNPDLASRSKFWGVLDSWQAYFATGLRNNFPNVFNSLPEAITRAEYYGVTVRGKANEISVDSEEVNSPAKGAAISSQFSSIEEKNSDGESHHPLSAENLRALSGTTQSVVMPTSSMTTTVEDTSGSLGPRSESSEEFSGIAPPIGGDKIIPSASPHSEKSSIKSLSSSTLIGTRY